MRLVISEKPSVAADLAAVLGGSVTLHPNAPAGARRKEGHFEVGDYIVSYCYGHLLELTAPDAYGESYAKWRYDDLPIIPQKWIHTPVKGKAAHLKILTELLNRPDLEYVVNACDAGREG